MGNICRSPTAEGIFAQQLREAGLVDQITVDSAGTSAYSVGEPADPRSRETARARGIELQSRGRQFEFADLDEFDYVIAMDRRNLSALHGLTRDPLRLGKIHLLGDFDSGSGPGADVPDPYSGGPGGFDRVFEQIEAACRGLLEALRAELGERE
jgi:protein-tyrosine phosphatase